MKEGDIQVRVWDLPTRLFHWLLALCVVTSLLTGFFDGILGKSTFTWHQRAGYCAVGLVAFRLVWGFVGGTYARFASFLKGPGAIARYLASWRAGGNGEPTLGHNPLGGWSVMAMLAALGTQAVTGLFLSLEDYGFQAPLAKYVSGATSDRLNALHGWIAWVVIALVALHLGAILFYAVVKKTNLVTAMVTGFRRVRSVRPQDPSRGGNVFLGLAAAGAVGYSVWWLVTRG